MMSTTTHPSRVGERPPTSALTERTVLRLGLALTACFVAASLVAFPLPDPMGHWAGVHLALAGAALVAVGTLMPHFGVTLAGTASERPELRLLGVAALAIGALLAVGGVTGRSHLLVLGGAAGLWLGLAVTAWTTFRPARQPLARRHPIAKVAYAVALADVTVGIALAALSFGGVGPVAGIWSQLKPAHIWLNLFGFLSLTIGATLVYLYPTIAGARIQFQRSLAVMVGGAFAGPPIVAVGAFGQLHILATIGALLTLAGAAGQIAYVIDVGRRRGIWTTDLGWHRVSDYHVVAGVGWYLAAVATVAVGVWRDGLPPGWGLGMLAVPLVLGWVLQVLAGAATYLVPGVAIAEPEARGRARRLLGRAWWLRLAAWNVGVGLAWLGLAAGSVTLALAGMGSFSLAALGSIGLLSSALLRARTARRSSGAPSSR